MTITTLFTSRPATALLLVASLGIAGCSDRPPTGVFGDPTPLLGSVRLNVHAINLIAGETAQLTSNTFNVGGEAITDLDSLTYTSTSTSRVTVSPTGLITAGDVTEEPVPVIVSAARDRVTQVDTVMVNVLPPVTEPPVRFAVRLDGDSTEFGVGGGSVAYGYLITADDDTIPDVLISVRSKDPNIVSLYRYIRDWYVNAISPGQTRLYISATLSGVTYTDSIDVTVEWAVDQYYGFYNNQWNPSSLQYVIQPGGAIHWSNYNSDPSPAVTFDDPSTALPDTAGAPSGNIDPFSGTAVTRRFAEIGTYKWHSTLPDGRVQNGTIIVKANP